MGRKYYGTREGASKNIDISCFIDNDIKETKAYKRPSCMLCGRTGCYFCVGTGIGYTRDIERYKRRLGYRC